MGDVSAKARVSLNEISNRTKFFKENFENEFERNKFRKLREKNKYSVQNTFLKKEHL